MAYNDSPCKNCTERCYKCHIECESYKLFAEQRKRVNELRLKAREQNEAFFERFNKIKYGDNKSKIFKSPKR